MEAGGRNYVPDQNAVKLMNEEFSQLSHLFLGVGGLRDLRHHRDVARAQRRKFRDMPGLDASHDGKRNGDVRY